MVLPNEIWMEIFAHADLRTLYAASLASRLLHATSCDAFIPHVGWKNPEGARQHILTFWSRYPEKCKRMRTLSMQFMPQPKGQAIPFEAHREIFTSMAMFGGLVEMVLCNITVPDSFFVLLNKLPRLRRLSVRQAVIPRPPETLSSPPPLESLILAFLTPRHGREHAYSPYFLHLFPSTNSIKIDWDPCPHGGPLPTTSLCSPTYLSMGDDHMEFTWPSNVYLQALSRFDLNNLEHLVVNAPWLTFPPFPEEYPTHVFSSKLPRLRTLFAPLEMVFALVRSSSALTSVSVQGGILYTERALRLVDDLQRFCPLLTTLAFTLVLWDKSVVWDNSVVRSISERLPHLEALEILYHQCDPACTSPCKPSQQLCASDLSKFSNLHTLHIHPFPPVAWEGFFLAPPPQTPGHRDDFASTPCAMRLAVETLTGSSRTLERVRLAYDHDASQTWVRVEGEWKAVEERHMDIEWSSASILSEDLRYVM
uniref:F-box domain-containing protein n=1 Tax=Mycena chlorophos TaxID=658473 RepID=A0ABQ0LH83_MYCCL|nr:predicted protein [Mycena chlorophos]